MDEVRTFLRNNMPEKIGDTTVAVIDGPFTDDYFNVIEVACAIRDPESPT